MSAIPPWPRQARPARQARRARPRWPAAATVLTAMLAAVLALAWPDRAAAHAAERGLILLLPTGYYLTGGALAVAVTFLVMGLAPKTWGLGRVLRAPLRLPRLGDALSWAGFLAFAGLVATGFLGAHNPLANPLPLTVWTLWWVGLVAATALVGGLWAIVDPWRAPVGLIARWTGPAPFRLPAWIGFWPAILGFFAFAWFEIADTAPDDPTRLARAAAIFWLVQAAAMLLFGPARWRARGEPFSVFFRLIGRVAPLHLGRVPKLSWPGARLVRGRAWPVSGWLFVSMVLAAVTFDGLCGTFWWLGLTGVNPLEFPGRSAVAAESTAGLAGTFAAMAAAYALSVALGWALVPGARPGLGRALGALARSLLPIALAYHLAHYLTNLLVNGQYALLAATDPLGTGADWLGLGAYPVTTSFLNRLESVEVIWQVQVALIVGGHLLAVLAAHAIALRLWPGRREAVLAQIPLAGLMVAYTALGLWLLSTPTAF